jgi:magnesium chelatase family protein
MKVKSFMRYNQELMPVEVELSLTPGLPQISFLGLPDTALRESTLRIRSALKHQNFEFPKARQVLVHLKPSHLKKSSRGLDLAVAAALLWETEQVALPQASHADLFVYGELSLKGEVIVPDDIEEAEAFMRGSASLITGKPQNNLNFNFAGLSELKNLNQPQYFEGDSKVASAVRPACKVLSFSFEQAELLKLIAVGEHSALLGGPPGCGKTTVAESISSFLQEPSLAQLGEFKKIAKRFHHHVDWRPVVSAHHSITSLAMLGGGLPLRPGEIVRAHGGVLIMDELLEFSSKVQEALREPLESGHMGLARNGVFKEWPSKFILVGTTNLCPCGRYDLENESRCLCRLRRRENYLERLSGPFVDRFHIFKVMSEKNISSKRQVEAVSILDEVLRAIQFRLEIRGQTKPNADLSYEEVLHSSGLSQAKILSELSDISSHRRQLSTLKVARTLADLVGRSLIKNEDLNKAKLFSARDFRKLHSRDFESL